MAGLWYMHEVSLGVWSQPGLWGWKGGGGQGSELSCFAYILPHKILSILRIHTWGKNEIVPPTVCYGVKCGPDLLNILDLLGVRGGGGRWCQV